MKVSRKRRPPLRLCALVALSLGMLVPAGAAHATAPGTVVTWGCSGANFAQCSVPGDLANVTAIAAGDYQSLAVKNDGTVVAWGCSFGANYGQCNVPSNLIGVTSVAAGTFHSLALRSDGTVVAWGCFVDFGQCNVPTGLSGVTGIAAGTFHSLAVKSDGSVVAWGCGQDFGQCNVSDLSGVIAVAGSETHSLFLTSDGTVVARGCGPFSDRGQCSVPSGLSGVTAIAAGRFHSLALKSDGTVVAWGCGDDFSNRGQCTVPSDLSGVTAISAGESDSIALKSDGTVVAWGCGGPFGDSGQCNVPSDLSGVGAIAAGRYHSLALGAPSNAPPNCSTVTATPGTISQMRGKMALITLSGATDPDGDALSYQIDGVTQDEYVTGVGDDTSPDGALTSGGASSNQVLVRSEANSHFNGRVYRIAYTVSDGHGGNCAGTAGPSGTTTATVGVPRKKGGSAIDDGNTSSWNSFTGARIS
jgi:Regulator of chromosome condensation (RCC1) repeat